MQPEKAEKKKMQCTRIVNSIYLIGGTLQKIKVPKRTQGPSNIGAKKEERSSQKKKKTETERIKEMGLIGPLLSMI